MKKLVLKSLPFFSPFLILYTINILFYNVNEGDLQRIGYLYSNPSPKSKLKEQFHPAKGYVQSSELTTHSTKKFNVVTIGDSFSNEQGVRGYNNYLALDGLTVLNVEHSDALNPIQSLVKLMNGGFFDTVSTQYLVLESVERDFVNRCVAWLNFDLSLSYDSIYTLAAKGKENYNKYDFFSDATLKVPITNFEYLFINKPYFSSTYKFSSESSNLFSNHPSHILVFKNDILHLHNKNDTTKIKQANQVINRISTLLKAKGIKLILIIAPDKYDIYFPYLKDKKCLQPSHFFTIFNQYPHNYIYIPADQLLTEKVKSIPDIYYYDDTHWTPIAAKLIASKISSEIQHVPSIKN